MRVLIVVVLAASVVCGDYRVTRMKESLRRGETDAALQQAEDPEVLDLLATWYGPTRELYWDMIAHNDRLARKKPKSCERVLDLARKIGKRALELRASDEEARIIAAEVHLIAGHYARARKEKDWIEHWRRAARELAQGSGAGKDWVLVRAVQILGEGAREKGAPAAALIAEAKTVALKDARGESGASPAYLAYRLELARYLLTTGKKSEAAKALGVFRGLGAKLGGRADDRDRATLHNFAVALSRKNGLGMKEAFKTTRETAGFLVFDLPVSRFWSSPAEHWDDGAIISQVTPDGRELRSLYLNWYDPRTPWSDNTPSPKDAKGMARLRHAQVVGYFEKLRKKSNPKAGRFNRNLPKGRLFVADGFLKNGRWRSSRHCIFEDAKRKAGQFEASTWSEGKRLPSDPLFDAVVASVR